MSSRARPVRMQLRRTRGWRKPEGAVVVSRPSRWGNPWRVGPGLSAAEAAERYREWVEADPQRVAEIRRELAGRDLCCWCPPGQPCHGDVLLEIANSAGDEAGGEPGYGPVDEAGR